jgi:hypothetical protein
MEPASCSVPKSSSTSSWSGPMKLEDAPPGWMAPRRLPARDPAGQVEQFACAGAHRDAVHAGPFHVARDGEEFQARMVAPPCAFHHGAPLAAMTGTWANVSTEFISVGLPCRP